MPRLSAGRPAANIGALSRRDDMMDFTLNGQPQRLALAPDYPLLDALRQHLGLHSVRLGCGLVQLTSDKQRPEARRFYESLGFVASHEGMKLAL